MKTSIYIESGITQLVLTPETDFEKKLLKEFDVRYLLEARAIEGEFTERLDGFCRQNAFERSLMIVMRPTQNLVPKFDF